MQDISRDEATFMAVEFPDDWITVYTLEKLSQDTQKHQGREQKTFRSRNGTDLLIRDLLETLQLELPRSKNELNVQYAFLQSLWWTVTNSETVI